MQDVSVIGLSATSSSILGLDCSSIAKQLEDYLSFLEVNTVYYEENAENRAKELCDFLKEAIPKLSDSKTILEKLNNGREIHQKIQSFRPKAKEVSDINKESIIKN